MQKINIVVVDDHQIVRDGIMSMFLAHDTIHVVGEAHDSESLWRVLEQVSPNVLVMDICMPGKSGVEIVEQIKKNDEYLKILMLSASTDEENIMNAIQSGANGFLSKDTSREEFEQAIYSVYNGEAYFGANLSHIIYQGYVKQTRNQKNSQDETPLSEREIQIIKLLSDGLSSKQIGEKLCISARTVESHKSNILEKLNLKTNADIIKYAIKNRIVKL